MNARTPGPWTADGGVIIPDGDTYQENGDTYARPNSGQDAIAQLVSNHADAAFIVTACNNHDALVAAMRDLLTAYETRVTIGDTEGWAEASKARAALAQVQS